MFLAFAAIAGVVIAGLVYSERQRDAREREERNAAERARLQRCREYAKRTCTVVEVREISSWIGHNYEAVVHCDDGARYATEHFRELRAGDVADPQRESECG